MTWRSLPSSGSLGSRAIAKRGLYALAVFERLGAKPPESSRLPSAIRLIRALNDQKASLHDPRTLERVESAQKTIWEFFVVAYIADLRRNRASQLFPREKLELALSGAEVEAEDSNHLHRNIQFELYTTALLAAGGAEVWAGEPDISLTIGPTAYGVAAKRISSLSPSKIEARMLEGAKQIAGSSGEGYLAVNIDAYFRGHGLSAIEEERLRLFSEKLRLVQSVCLKHFAPFRHLRGVLIYGHLSAWDLSSDPPRHGTVYPTAYQLFSDDHRPSDYERESAFWSGYTARLERQLQYLRSEEFSGP